MPWLVYYRALEHSPVGLVSVIGATYGGVTAVLAGAAPSPRPRRRDAPAPRNATAPAAPPPSVTRYAARHQPAARTAVLALVSALTYGTGAFLLGSYSPRSGWLLAALAAYAMSVAALIVARPFLCRA